MKTFAERLRYARNLRSLTQAGLAAACGLSQGAIANYEGGSRAAPKDIFGLASALQVNALWLRHGKGEMELVSAGPARIAEPTPAGHTPSWPFERLAPDTYWALSPHDRRLIENTVLTLIASLPGDA